MFRLFLEITLLRNRFEVLPLLQAQLSLMITEDRVGVCDQQGPCDAKDQDWERPVAWRLRHLPP
jgi:hypothetical protein